MLRVLALACLIVSANAGGGGGGYAVGPPAHAAVSSYASKPQVQSYQPQQQVQHVQQQSYARPQVSLKIVL